MSCKREFELKTLYTLFFDVSSQPGVVNEILQNEPESFYPTRKNMFKWLLWIRVFISYQNIHEKSIILENKKSQAEALATELPIKKSV